MVLPGRILLAGEEKAENVVEAGGPGLFVVDGSGSLHVGEVLSFVPAETEEQAVEVVRIANVARALGGAHVQPDAQGWSGLGLVDEGENAAVIPPDGGGHDCELAKDVRIFEAQKERYETTQRGSAESGVGGAGTGAVGAVYKGF
jgi:hypothetical protein